MKKKKSIMGQSLFEWKDDIHDKNDQKIRQTIQSYLIGDLVIEINGLEADIELSFCDIMHDDAAEPGMMIIGSMRYNQKCKIRYKYIIRRLGQFESQKAIKLRKSMDEIYKSLVEIGTFRNKVIHGFREDQDEYGYIRTSSADFGEDGIAIEVVKILNKDIKNCISKIEKVRRKIDNVSEKFYEVTNS